MKILIITQKVDKNDSILGFFHAWIIEFSKHFEKVLVLCLEKGEYSLPDNVEVHSLEKERYKKENRENKIISKISYVRDLCDFVICRRAEYDKVFVHMNPEYIVLGGVLWKILNKKIYLWYVHRQVNLKLKIAHLFSTHIFSSVSESFGINSDKVSFVGHGIDINKFEYNKKEKLNDILNITTVGRITKIKRLEIVLEAMKELKDKNIKFILNIVGEAIKDGDFGYQKYLKELVVKLDLEREVVWKGSLRGDNLKNIYKNADLTINACPTGGMDKVVLESFVSGVPCFAHNRAFKAILGESSDTFLFDILEGQNAIKPSQNGVLTSYSLSQKIENFIKNVDFQAIQKISQKVRENFSKEVLIKNISQKMLEKN